MTSTQQGGSRWGIHDEVIQLREWGSQRTHVLPPQPGGVTLGTSPTCTFRVEDSEVSREHLSISYIEGRWCGVDNLSKNGTRVDGVRTHLFSLSPGCEISAGRTTMIAESPQWIRLQRFLCRILGWRDNDAVDRALRSIRHAALGRSPLYLGGNGDLAPIAASLHRFVWSGNAPFIMCDPRRADAEESARSAANKSSGLDALAAACPGTLCVRARRPPDDIDAVLRHLQNTATRVLLVVVDTDENVRFPADTSTNPPIEIPDLQQRVDQLPAIIDEYADEAAETLVMPRSFFTDGDRSWVIEHAATSLPEVEKATQRIIALRGSRNLTSAARRLGMAPVSLARWLDRRTLPAGVATYLND